MATRLVAVSTSLHNTLCHVSMYNVQRRMPHYFQCEIFIRENKFRDKCCVIPYGIPNVHVGV